MVFIFFCFCQENRCKNISFLDILRFFLFLFLLDLTLQVVLQDSAGHLLAGWLAC